MIEACIDSQFCNQPASAANACRKQMVEAAVPGRHQPIEPIGPG